MATEEQELLRGAVKEFGEKYILNIRTNIEREGISKDLRRSLSSQGFLGIAIPQDLGGAGESGPGYATVLMEFASYSPSVSALILIANSVTSRLVGENSPEVTAKIASGELNIGVSLYPYNEGATDSGSLTVSGGRIKGTRRYIFNASEDGLLTLTDDHKLVLIRSGVNYEDEEHHLAFRGLPYRRGTVDSEDFDVLSENGLEILGMVMDGMDLEVAAMAIGTARAALYKAVEYTKVRKTFEMPLKDYSPVANTLSRLLSELRLAEISMDSSRDLSKADRLMLKMFCLDLAKRATKSALQLHGGYGYIEDFGVENFYRDAAGLSILFRRPAHDNLRLSREVFGEKSGYI